MIVNFDSVFAVNHLNVRLNAIVFKNKALKVFGRKQFKGLYFNYIIQFVLQSDILPR